MRWRRSPSGFRGFAGKAYFETAPDERMHIPAGCHVPRGRWRGTGFLSYFSSRQLICGPRAGDRRSRRSGRRTCMVKCGAAMTPACVRPRAATSSYRLVSRYSANSRSFTVCETQAFDVAEHYKKQDCISYQQHDRPEDLGSIAGILYKKVRIACATAERFSTTNVLRSRFLRNGGRQVT